MPCNDKYIYIYLLPYTSSRQDHAATRESAKRDYEPAEVT